MKLSLPRHVPIRRLLPFLGAVVTIQIVEGSNPVTALGYGAFLVITADAFNAVGGMIYPSGAFIAFFALLTVGLGGLLKMALGEPLDSNVLNAQHAMLVYVAGAATMWVAAQIASRIRRSRPMMSNFEIGTKAPQIALGAALMAQFGWILVPASATSTFNQLNNFFSVGILVLSYSKAKETNGAKSFTVLAFIIWLYATIFWGILTFSKAGIFTPSLVWAVGALVAGYHASVKKLILLVTAAVLASAILTPVAQIGRNYRGRPDSGAIAWQLLEHPLETRRTFLAGETTRISQGGSYHWFNQPQGLLDRLTMFPIDAALIHVTDQGHTRGIFPIVTYVTNMVPRYLLSGEKPVYHWGNRYAHEIGLLGKHDFSTGVSFSPVAEGYHCLSWMGVTLVSMPLYLILFAFCDSLTGSTEQTFWAALYIISFSHSAPEGLLNVVFASISTVAAGVVVMALSSRWILPYIGGLFIPPRRDTRSNEPVDFARWTPPTAATRRPSMARTIEESL